MLPYRRGARGGRDYEDACKFRNSCPDLFCKNSSSENFGTFSRKPYYWATNLRKCGMKK